MQCGSQEGSLEVIETQTFTLERSIELPAAAWDVWHSGAGWRAVVPAPLAEGVFVVTFPCGAADLAEPYGGLDFVDVQAFLGAFGAMEPPADLASPSGVFDFSDVFAFLVAFAAGCS